jgi:hypothetical protein
MEKTLKNQKIYEISESIGELKELKAHFKFHYALNKTTKVLNAVLKNMPKYVPPKTETYENFIKVVEDKIKTEKIKFTDMSEVSSFYEKEIENYPEAKQDRINSLKIFKEVIEKWENDTQTIFFHSISEDLFPNEITGIQAEFLEEYFLED